MHMAMTVVFDRMTSTSNFTRELRVSSDALSDAEKRRAGVVFLEQAENAGRDVRIGTIVDGQGYLPRRRRRARQADPVGTRAGGCGARGPRP